MTLFYSCSNLAYAKNEPGGIWKEESLVLKCKNRFVNKKLNSNYLYWTVIKHTSTDLAL